jgi:hypothetical protein
MGVCLDREKIIVGFLPTEAKTMSNKNGFEGCLGGKTNFLGFEIHDVWGGEAKSKHYRKGVAINFGLEWFLIIIAGGFPTYLIIVGTINAFWILLLIPLAFIAYLRLFRLLILELTTAMPYLGTNTKEWHATEHKLGYILENGGRKDLTLENLRKAPSSMGHRCSFNNRIKEPSEKKLKEALEVGKRYLTPHSSFFSNSRSIIVNWKKPNTRISQ